MRCKDRRLGRRRCLGPRTSGSYMQVVYKEIEFYTSSTIKASKHGIGTRLRELALTDNKIHKKASQQKSFARTLCLTPSSRIASPPFVFRVFHMNMEAPKHHILISILHRSVLSSRICIHGCATPRRSSQESGTDELIASL